MPDAEIIKKLDFKNPATWTATWFGCGLMHPAPGTWGTLGALPIGLILAALGGKIALLAGIVVVFALGLWAAAQFEKMTGTHDSSMIVIDEVAGMWITLLASTLSPLSIVMAFALFRFFDVLKPWPIGWLDKKVNGAWGVMLDDCAAGKLAALCLWGIHHYAFIG
ncbi:MAG: phosphatidylglycerophosphatase A [Micavibrio aeruginosavorus]|uniref:Phosphatidylglycerophosphatase A n=1 Tax=Micavibrio aeruginosavorus TaxID=349221 RepID=A0A2W5A4F3_9BACT|nr:MAG: phosphatidylglycerophosphatase A [Micavibrio aeruginosavorus]